jgi:hypothetical protein
MENWKLLPIAMWVCLLLLIMGKMGFFGEGGPIPENTINLDVRDFARPQQVVITNMEMFPLTGMRITINEEYAYQTAISLAPGTAVVLDKLLFLGPTYKPAAGVRITEIEVIADQGRFYRNFEI